MKQTTYFAAKVISSKLNVVDKKKLSGWKSHWLLKNIFSTASKYQNPRRSDNQSQQ